MIPLSGKRLCFKDHFCVKVYDEKIVTVLRFSSRYTTGDLIKSLMSKLQFTEQEVDISLHLKEFTLLNRIWDFVKLKYLLSEYIISCIKGIFLSIPSLMSLYGILARQVSLQ